jgi:hypothetical protein
MHGGEAIMESKLGQGTTVRLRLPHAAVNANGEPLTAEPAAPAPLPIRLKGAA